MKPLLTLYERNVLKRELVRQARQRNNKPLRILEWGSGGSTVYFPAFLDKKGIAYEWTSIEYNARWYKAISERVADNPHVTVVLFDVGNDVLRQRNTDMEEYIHYPRTRNQLFDFIFVDGRKRRRCVLLARDLLNENGVVFLHDAQRKHYQCSFTAFDNQGFAAPNLWRGYADRAGVVTRGWNIVRSYIYTLLHIFFIRPIHHLAGNILSKKRATDGLDIRSKGRALYTMLLLSLKKRGWLSPHRKHSLRASNGSVIFTFSCAQYLNPTDFIRHLEEAKRVYNV